MVVIGCVSVGLVLYSSARAGMVPNHMLNGGALRGPCCFCESQTMRRTWEDSYEGFEGLSVSNDPYDPYSKQ